MKLTQHKNEWWRGAVFYQIYPRSFMDANNDGIGDLAGITSRLDYVASLGVDAIWISPFFKSPMKDFGYDVADYRAVDPMFGALDDFRALLDKAHDLGLKIVIDLVMSHTSDQHEWFQESRISKDNDKADWYVWADPLDDGSPPNNWQSFFGGPSWSFDMRRGQYYMHNFLSSQPDLNAHHPAVQEAILDTFRFWLDFGVDGFRLDVANCYMHDPELRDNPAAAGGAPKFFNVDFPVPFTMQDHVYDYSRPENMALVKKIRALLDEYDDRMSVAEIAYNPYENLAADYTRGDENFHTAYNFTLISGRDMSASFIRGAFDGVDENSWPSWAFSNHDVVRVMTRWVEEGKRNDPRIVKLLIALLASLRGTAFLYQGEELGLPDASIPFEKLQDPWGKYLWPQWQGRDGCRTPMPWDSGCANAGFNEGVAPWLPVADEHKNLSVAQQEADENAPLHFVREFLSWRKTQSPLITGAIEFLDFADDKVLGFIREDAEGAALLCLFNLDNAEKRVDVPKAQLIRSSQFVEIDGGRAVLPPYGMAYASLVSSS
jgi:alpha-glucosidase